MADDAALRSSLVWLAAIVVFIGAYTYSFKKMMVTYVFGIFAIAGLLLPDWDFFDRPFSQWCFPVSMDETASSSHRSIWTRFRIHPLRLFMYTTVYGIALYKWWKFVSRWATAHPCPMLATSMIKGVTNGFPLRLEVEKVFEKPMDFNVDFLKKMFLKIKWKALVDASRVMGCADLPDEAEPSMLDSDEFLKKFCHALLELHLEEGALICLETGRRFPINKGIPNMLLHEDEV